VSRGETRGICVSFLKLYEPYPNEEEDGLWRKTETWSNPDHRKNTRAEICPTLPGGVETNSRGSEPVPVKCLYYAASSPHKDIKLVYIYFPFTTASSCLAGLSLAEAGGNGSPLAIIHGRGVLGRSMANCATCEDATRDGGRRSSGESRAPTRSEPQMVVSSGIAMFLEF
jgi:hypothetical protein